MSLAGEVAGIGFWSLGQTGTPICWSQAVHRIFGHDPALGVPDAEGCLAYYHPESRDSVMNAFVEARQSGSPFSLECRLLDDDEGPRYVSLDGDVRREAGRVVGLYGIIKDISLRRREQEELERRGQSLFDLLHALPAPVYRTDRDGYILDYNEAAARFWGQAPEVGVSRWCGSLRIFTTAGDALPLDQCPMAVALKEGRPVRGVTAVVERPDGVRTPFMPYPTPLYDAEGVMTGGVNMLVDVSAQQEAEARQAALIEDLRQARDDLIAQVAAAEKANRAKSTFLANMSHEVRTPLNGVLGVAAALARESLTPSQDEMVGLIAGSALTLEKVLSDILDISKVEAGKLDFERRPFNLAHEVLAAAQGFARQAEAKGLAFSFHFAEAAKGRFIGDSVRLRQIVANLVSNAVKFTHQGSVAVSVDLSEGQPRLVVRDTGVGFDDANAQRLFEPFEQDDASITRRFGGTGLGLSICQALVTQWGGEMVARSAPGTGSEFTVVLPMQPAPALAVVEDTAASALVESSGLRVLLAEDHPTNQKVVQLLLAPLGAELTIVENGEEALAAFERSAFDIILMDMQMPVMDGLSAVREIRQREAIRGGHVPIAMLSANALAEHHASGLAAGADQYVTKPVSAASLYAGMEAAMTAALEADTARRIA